MVSENSSRKVKSGEGKRRSTWDDYAEMGQKWLKGELGELSEFNGYKLNAKQREFVNSKSRFTLVSGGYASGKTTAFIIKLILLCLWFPNNRILLGRKTRMELERVTLPDFFDICPEGTYEYKVGPGIIRFGNGSEIILFGLDSLQSGSGQDIKKAEQAIKSLNLGAIFIDQLEEIELRVFEALDGRLRRNVGFLQMNLTTNPANYWAYDYFKANPKPRTHLIETSMLDNKEFLPSDYLESQLSKTDTYVRRYVYGEWTPDLMIQGTVFDYDVVQMQENFIKMPKKERDGIKIWEEPGNFEVQIGIDPSEGVIDPCCIQAVRTDNGEQVAVFSDFVNHSTIAEKAIQIALLYSLKRKPLMIPEATGAGQTTVELIKRKGYERIYEREVFNSREKKTTKRLGFAVNYATKNQLIEHTKDLFTKRFPKIRDKQTLDEFKTFVYSDEVRKRGAGAESGFHDDRIMALLLAFWNIEAPTLREKNFLDRMSLKRQKPKSGVKYQYD